MERKALESHEVSEMALDLLGQINLFFSRTEAKASVILGVDTGMIWYLATKLPPIKTWDIHMLSALLPLGLIAASVCELYRSSFPQLKGGRESLISFKEIAKRTEDRFLTDFTKRTAEELAQDLLGQVWRNSKILTKKIHCLKRAYTFCASAVLAWGFAIAVLVNR